MYLRISPVNKNGDEMEKRPHFTVLFLLSWLFHSGAEKNHRIYIFHRFYGFFMSHCGTIIMKDMNVFIRHIQFVIDRQFYLDKARRAPITNVKFREYLRMYSHASIFISVRYGMIVKNNFVVLVFFCLNVLYAYDSTKFIFSLL